MAFPVDPSFLMGSGLLGLGLAIWATSSALRRDHHVDWMQLKLLSDKGVNLELPREVEFCLFVRTQASAEYVSGQLSNEGFAARHEPSRIEIRKTGSGATHAEEGHLVVARKVVVLYGTTLGELRKRMTRLAQKEDGHYLGWRAIDESHLGSSA